MVCCQPRYLGLKDGSVWRIEGHDPTAREVVVRLADAMCLSSRARRYSNNLLVRTGKATSRGGSSALCRGVMRLPGASVQWQSGGATCFINRCDTETDFLSRVMSVSLVISRYAETGGGLLVHAGLAEYKDAGVLLSGISGVGKTTASGRLRAPWKALSDDATLIVRDRRGVYWAHAWPTWSNLFENRPIDRWPVGAGLPLRGIFLLSRTDRSFRRLDLPRAAAQILNRAHEVSWDIIRSGNRDQARPVHVQLFGNACDLARAVPCHVLHVTLRNAFWKPAERLLAG
jgi:SynChlorMet cassette protein ScmC